MMPVPLLIAIGAGIGAPLRYLIDRFVQDRHDWRTPWGTFTVNLIASAALGLLTGAGARLGPGWHAALGTGLCGALSTYSTFGYETVQLVRTKAFGTAFGYTVGSIVAGVLAAWAGFWLTS